MKTDILKFGKLVDGLQKVHGDIKNVYHPHSASISIQYEDGAVYRLRLQRDNVEVVLDRMEEALDEVDGDMEHHENLDTLKKLTTMMDHLNARTEMERGVFYGIITSMLGDLPEEKKAIHKAKIEGLVDGGAIPPIYPLRKSS